MLSSFSNFFSIEILNLIKIHFYRATLSAMSAFLEAFQKVADISSGTKGGFFFIELIKIKIFKKIIWLEVLKHTIK